MGQRLNTFPEKALVEQKSENQSGRVLVGLENRMHKEDPGNSYTYDETVKYMLTAGYNIKDARDMWTDQMPCPPMEVTSQFDKVMQEISSAVHIFTTAPRFAVDFLKKELSGRRIVATFNRPGDCMDEFDVRSEWWTRWATQTVGSAVSGCYHSGLDHIVLCFVLDKNSQTKGSVWEWGMKEIVADLILTESSGLVEKVSYVVVDCDEVLQFFGSTKAKLTEVYERCVCNRVIWVRHAESEANLTGKDLKDSVLSEVGVSQAKHLVEKIAQLGVTKIIVSPMRRAIQTAALARVDTLGAPVTLLQDVQEVATGEEQNKLEAREVFEDWCNKEAIPYALRGAIDTDTTLLNLVAKPPFGEVYLVFSHFYTIRNFTGVNFVANAGVIDSWATPAPERLVYCRPM